MLPELADDPHLLIATGAAILTRRARRAAAADAEEIIATVLADADGLDLVGLYAGGPIYRGFANSLGQRNWHEATAFNLQWSLYHRADKAVKYGLSRLHVGRRGIRPRRCTRHATQLADIARPPKTLAPGNYRAYLTPSAIEEIGVDAVLGRILGARSGDEAKQPGADAGNGADGLALDPRVTMAEATADGVAPAFQAEGFARPARVPLIEAGRLVGSLCSRAPHASSRSTPTAPAATKARSRSRWRAGRSPPHDALAALGTGIYAGNLHYLNYSDRPAGRMTGMTRFATFWVENGKIVAPIDVLRFDDTIYRMLGANLEALTAETELLLASDSYHERALASMRLPGVLLSEMAFTL